MDPQTEVPVDCGSDPDPVQNNNSTSPEELAVMIPSPNWFFPSVLAVSPDGWVVYGALTRGLCILQPINGNFKIKVITYAHGDRVSCVALSDSWLTDRRLLTSSVDGVVKHWKLQQEDDEFRLVPINAHNVHKLEKEEVISATFCGDNSALSVGSSGVLVKWDLTANITRIYKKQFKTLKPTAAAKCPHNPFLLAIGTKQGVLFVVDFHAKANILYRVRGHDDEITGLCWCPQAEVNIHKAQKYSASNRMNIIRNIRPQQSNDETTTQKVNCEESLNATINNESLNKDKESFNETTDKEETMVVEDDTFDIYADHDHEEFGHSKYVPEEIVVPVDKPAENLDFLAECLKLKKDIMDNKNKQEQSMHSLVESLEKASICKEIDSPRKNEGIAKDQIDGTKKNETNVKVAENSETSNEVKINGTSKRLSKENGEINVKVSETTSQESKSETEEQNIQTHTNILFTIDKNGKCCLWSKNGKQLSNSVLSSRMKHSKNNTTNGALHWYRSDILLTSDGHSVFECNPLFIDSHGKIEFKVLHSAHKRGLYCIASAAPMVQDDSWTPDCDIWSVSQDRHMVLYSYSKRQTSRVYSTFGGYVYHISPCPYDANRLAIACGDGNVRVCELRDDVANPCHTVACYWQHTQGRITVTAWHPSRDKILAFATAEGRVGLIDTTSSKEKPARLLGGPLRRGVYALSWNNANILYVCCVGELFLYDISKHDPVITQIEIAFEGKRWSPTEVVWNERGLCVGGKDGEVGIVTSSQPHQVLAAAFTLQKMVQCIVWHPESVTLSDEVSPCKNWIAAAANDPDFVVFDLCEEEGGTKLRELCTLRGHKQPVVRLCWSPHRDGQILSTSQDTTVRVWDVKADGAACTHVFDGHQGNTLAAVWWPLPGAQCVLSGGGDHTLRLWDISQCPAELPDNKPNIKNAQFAMALPENDAKKEKKEIKDKPVKNAVNPSDDSEDEDKDTNVTENEQMAVNFENVKKKINKKCLFPISHKQMTHNGLKACRKLVRRIAKKNELNEEVDDEDIGFLNLFGTLDKFNEQLDKEQEHLLSRERLDLWTTLGIMRGHVDRVFQMATSLNILSPFLLSIAPMVSHRFWKDQMQAYIVQSEKQVCLEERPKTNFEFEERPNYSTLGVHRKLILMLSQHNISGAIEMLTGVHLYREAYVLARVRHMESTATDLLNQWAAHMEEVGNRVQSAVCYLLLGKLVEASTILSKLAEQEALDTAAEIAKISGQETFADSLLKKKEDLSQKADELLKSLPDRLALHLQMRQENGISEKLAETEKNGVCKSEE